MAEETMRSKRTKNRPMKLNMFKNYRLAGIVVLVLLAVGAVIAGFLVSTQGSGVVNAQLNAAFFGLVFACVVIAVGLLYVLLTLRSNLELARDEAILWATNHMGARASLSEPAAAPTPTVDYGES